MAPLLEEVRALRAELDAAAEALLGAAERGLAAADRADLEGARQALCAVMQASSFHDLASQRLDAIARPAEGRASTDPLLNGPAQPGTGLDQGEADRLFGAAPAQENAVWEDTV